MPNASGPGSKLTMRGATGPADGERQRQRRAERISVRLHVTEAQHPTVAGDGRLDDVEHLCMLHLDGDDRQRRLR